ncbi:hypothetical protein Ssi03_37460 [Sphaerisporangium siamense]|uniref:Uncharacterized protein (TIGR02246 family) n=1 Tax=Sphaerisporangium siamense TaxID=795645 RepID=A0A7W7D9U2_9ACTN|nr:SgcJ/EcaC family oxidoreductase [Sphaerisporangium siamense]MBB4701631.1 uncharacterized protein (TIGR02246 family) [Sphaerisporangium siamense]GII85756.1 hypothetical protein Ssi03_37460 [Sphaerisporangium siamense]
MDIRRHTRRTVRLALIGGLGATLVTSAPPTAAVTPDATGPAASHLPSAPQDPDQLALRRVWERQAEAWARGDAVAYARVYTPDADLVNIKGEHLHDRRIIAARLQHYFDHDLKNTRILRLDERVRKLSPTTAIIVRRDCVLYGGETACRPDRLSINTSVVVKKAGQWLVTSFHNTLVQDQGAAATPLSAGTHFDTTQ